MSRKDFSHLLQKYLDDQCSPPERELVESWFTLLDDGDARWHRLEKDDLETLEQQLWARLQLSIHPSNQASLPVSPPKMLPWYRAPMRMTAAVVFLAAGIGIVYLYTRLKPKEQEVSTAANWIKKVNQSDKPLSLVLEDSSRLVLSAGTAVYYPPRFSFNKRELKIEGAAFFRIAKDSTRPFYVHSQEITAQVLGTSFWILYDKAKQQSAVEVVTGKVAVYKGTRSGKETLQDEGVVLKPNEKVIFNNNEEVFITTLVDAPIPVTADSIDDSGLKMNFIYDEAPLAEVVKDLEDEYGISIIVGSEEMNNLLFTGNISSLDYYTKLKTICKSLAASYQITGNRILIQKI